VIFGPKIRQKSWTSTSQRSIQRIQESSQTLAKRYSINPKTVAKWLKRLTTADVPIGPKPSSMVLSAEQEAIAIALRQHTLLPLD
jgi:transposase-like protein